MDPEDALSRRETPHLSYTMVTHDGGKTWQAGSTSLFGQVTRARFSADGPGLGLIEYGDSATYPSEVYKLDWTTGKNQTIFRDKRYAITDVWLTKDGTSYLAGIEMAGQVRSIVPGQRQGLQKQRHEDLDRDGGGLSRRRPARHPCPAPTSRISGWPRTTA